MEKKRGPSHEQTGRSKAEVLKEEYLKYFTPPDHYVSAFEQVSVFDQNVKSYASNATRDVGRNSA
ncbi:MAG: hypothetical protein N0E58_08915 [Candidatus Thiodiazotropha endolucinida]|uniref:Uncharacterized protein n=1 Tax=Candidatus Thiodiazotropha taylori TaxID=2792791 RepID=A0A9E4NJ81_9GAMM|nr:hypothetical protein [Candidatus Thiodiazotropha taylori]MCW4236374.1 hypothetical protein [Candidatus Thiodiazotropha endolucinida]